MDKISLILLSVLTLTLAVLLAPGILAMNRGKILRNIALWLAIILGLALAYRTFGPEKTTLNATQTALENTEVGGGNNDSANAPAPDTSQGYTPPKE